MLAALVVRYAQQKPPSWAAGEDTKRARGESSQKKEKEGSDDRRIKSAGPSRPAVGRRQRFSQAHGSELIEPSIVASEDAGSHKRAKGRVRNNGRGNVLRKIRPAET